MRSRCGIRRAPGVAATLILVAGCSGGGSQNSPTPIGQPAAVGAQASARLVASIGRSDNSMLAPNATRRFNAPITTPSFVDADAAGKALIFVADAANGVVDVYPQAGKDQKMVGQLTRLAQPQGLTTDSSGNLWVANTNASNVLVYAPPYTKAPALTIPDTGEFPADVAVSATGVVAVTNICSAPHCGASTGSISFYAKGSTKKCATVSDATYNFARVMFATFDKSGTLYVDGLNSGYQTSIGVITGGCKATSIALLSQIYTVSFPGGILINSAGRIVIADPIQEKVDTFDPPVGGALGSPTAVTPLTGSLSPLGIALLASGKDFYTADSAGLGVSNEYAYVAGGTPANTITVGGQPVGVAVTPIQP